VIDVAICALGCRRDNQYDECEQRRTNGGSEAHCASLFARLSFACPTMLLRLRVARVERRDFRTKRNADSSRSQMLLRETLVTSET